MAPRHPRSTSRALKIDEIDSSDVRVADARGGGGRIHGHRRESGQGTDAGRGGSGPEATDPTRKPGEGTGAGCRGSGQNRGEHRGAAREPGEGFGTEAGGPGQDTTPGE